jgi:tetratricopeptide (TPR) repeat protein
MRKRFVIISLLFPAALAAAGLLYLKYVVNGEPAPAPSAMAPENVQKGIQEGVETKFRRSQYLPMIEVYRRMLEKYPDNIDLKKKLGMAYFGAAEYEKARPLLEEVERAGLADAEVRRELGQIRK